MSKAGALAATGVGGGGLAVGGYYAFGTGGSGTGTSEEKAQETTTTSDLLANVEAFTTSSTLTPSDLNTFKTDPVKEKECIKDLFGSDTVNLTTSTDNQENIPENFFGDTADAGAKSCLLINYEKKKGTDASANKWSGAFTWTWVFVNKDKAFINFNVATTTANQKLKLTGGFYLMEKSTTDSTSTWSVKWKDEVTDSGKELTSGDLATKFPQINSNSKVQVEDNKAHWGFLDEGTELKEQAKDPVKATYKWTLDNASGNTDSTVGVGEWSKDLGWWDNLYSVTKGKNFDLANKLAGFKGTWQKQTPAAK